MLGGLGIISIHDFGPTVDTSVLQLHLSRAGTRLRPGLYSVECRVGGRVPLMVRVSRGRNVSRQRFLSASRQRFLMVAVSLGSGSSWSECLSAAVPHGQSVSRQRFPMVGVSLGSGSSWTECLSAAVFHGRSVSPCQSL